MFLNWLLTIFPGELAAGWALLRRNLLFWLALSAISALSVAATLSYAPTDGAQADPWSILQFGLSIGVTFLLALGLDAASRHESLPAARIVAGLGRIPALLLYAVLAQLFAGIPSLLASAAVAGLLDGTPLQGVTAAGFGIVIYVSLLAWVCFVPFLVVLHRREQLKPDVIPETGWRSFLGVLWAFPASVRMSDGIRWRLAPYLLLPYFIEVLARSAPQLAELPLAAQFGLQTAIQFIRLLLQAVIFTHFCSRRSQAV